MGISNSPEDVRKELDRETSSRVRAEEKEQDLETKIKDISAQLDAKIRAEASAEKPAELSKLTSRNSTSAFLLNKRRNLPLKRPAEDWRRNSVTPRSLPSKELALPPRNLANLPSLKSRTSASKLASTMLTPDFLNLRTSEENWRRN